MGQKSQNLDDVIYECPNGGIPAVWTRLLLPALPLAVASFPKESPARLVLEQAPWRGNLDFTRNPFKIILKGLSGGLLFAHIVYAKRSIAFYMYIEAFYLLFAQGGTTFSKRTPYPGWVKKFENFADIIIGCSLIQYVYVHARVWGLLS